MRRHDNRRVHTRVPFQATVDLEFGHQKELGCATENLSTRGVLVLDIPERSLGDSCNLTLHLAGTGTDISLAMQGQVVHLEEKGIGIHFTKIDLDSYTHLRNIIYHNSADPDSLPEFPFDSE